MYQPSLFGDLISPLIVKKEFFLNDLNTLQKSIEYNYQFKDFDNLMMRSYVLQTPLSFIGYYLYEGDNTPALFCRQIIYTGFDLDLALKPRIFNLISEKVKEFILPAGNILESQTTYNYYDNPILKKSIEFTNSKNQITKSEFTYPFNYPQNSLLTKMVDSFVISPLVVGTNYLNSILQTEKTNTYFQHPLGGFLLQNQKIRNALTNTEDIFYYNSYNAKAKLLEAGKLNDIKTCYIWDYLQENPVAEVTNATQSQIAYTSFESDGTGNFEIPSSIRESNNAITGKKSYSLNNGTIYKYNLSNTLTYIVSYWTKNSVAFSITGTLGGYPIKGRTTNGWTYFEHKISGQQTIAIAGSGSIDELRLYPENALMTTFTYEPLIGITSQADQNSRIKYFDYDIFQRLYLIRDQDNNILKKTEYYYTDNRGGYNGCNPISLIPNWQPTTTAIRCKKDANGQFTGYQEQEERDLNSCSLMSTPFRWRVVGYDTSICPVPPSCDASACSNQGEGYACINGNCELGYKVFTSSSYDPSTNLYTCPYHYEYSDGTWSYDYSSTSSTACYGL